MTASRSWPGLALAAIVALAPWHAIAADPAAAAKEAAQGERALHSGDDAAALKRFVAAGRLAPDNRDYLAKAATLAAKLGNADSAAGLYQSLARLAAAAGDRPAVAAADAEISTLRNQLPAWVAEKQAAASQVPQAKQRAVAMWSRAHTQAVEAASAGDLAKALEAAKQATSIARDNLGDAHMATIVSLTDLAAIEGRSGQADQAEADLQTAIATAAKALGEAHPETLKVQYALADHQNGLAQYGRAVETWRAIAKAAASGLGPAHPQTLTAQLAAASGEINAGRLAEADALLLPACKAVRQTFGDWHLETARCLTSQGILARQRGDYPAAAATLGEARAIEQAAGAEPGPLNFTTRMEIALVMQKQGQLAEAQDTLDGVVRDAAAAGDNGSLTAAKSELVDILDDRGDYATAEKIATEILEQRTASLGAAHPATLATLVSLGDVYRKEGRLYDAEQAMNDAYERYRKVLGNDHPSTVVAANNLGEILEKEGIYERAEPYLRAALDGSRRVFGELHPTTLAGMNNLGLLYESQGVFEKAEALYKSVVAVQAKVGGQRNPDIIAASNNLAYLYMLTGEHAKAADLFRQVHAAWAKAWGPRHQNTLKALNNLARATAGQGQFAEAEKLFDQALAARRATLGDKHVDTLRSMHDLAALYRATKRFDQAKALLEKTLAGDEAVLGAAHPYTFETLNTLASVEENQGDLSGALAVRRTTFLRRNDFFERVLAVTGDNAREGYVRLHAPELAAYVALLSRQDDAVAGKGVLEASLHRKGMLLKVASEIRQVTRMARDPALTKVADELTAVRKRLAALTLSGPTAETRGRHAEVLAELEERINALEGELGRTSARFRQSVTKIDVDKLAAALPADGALVDFLVYGDEGKQKLAAAVLRRDGDTPVYKLVKYDDLAAIDAAILKYRKDIQNEEMDFDELLESGQAVYDLLWKPLAAAIDGKAKIFVVPDGTINILPIAALVDKQGKYLIERADIRILGSSRDLLPSTVPPAKGGYIIDAGPDYNTDEITGKDALEKAKSRSASAIQGDMRGMASGMRGLHFDPLPGAEREGQMIQKTIEAEGKKTTIFSRAAAQEKVLRELADPPEILHIATHGFFLKADDTLRKRLLAMQRGADIQVPPPGDNPLLRAGLAFAGINSNAPVLGEIDTDNDGVLTALEVLGLDLSGTRLAILSACETGLGEIHEGEGVYGLRRSFQEAGAKAVVSSLWEVSDAGTQTLMAALYKRLLAGQPPHQALREAQLEMLRISQWSAPYVWSAFFMVGG